MAQFMGPQVVSALRNLSKGKKAFSSGQLAQDEKVMQQHMHKPGGPPPGYPMVNPEHQNKGEVHIPGQSGHPYGGPAANHPAGPVAQGYPVNHPAGPVAQGYPVYHPNGGAPHHSQAQTAFRRRSLE